MDSVECDGQRVPEDWPAVCEALRGGPRAPVVAGFDAFVDESIRIVETRHSPDAFTPMSTIGDFGAWAAAAAGRSGSREFVCDAVEPGGCSVNMADGVTALGFPLDAFSGVGNPPHSVFAPFLARCRHADPVGMEPGRALVTEFQDGKLMLCGFSHFADFTPAHLERFLDTGRFRACCESAGAVVLTSWSVYPHMTACWEHIAGVTLRGMENHPRFFFDLADPASRAPADLSALGGPLRKFEGLGPVTLSLNGNEAHRLAAALELGGPDGDSSSETRTRAARLREALGIDEVSIHLVAHACTATAEGVFAMNGPYCAKPRKSAGAGDRFNAGLLAGRLLGLKPHGRLTLACAASGFFVRHARSGSSSEIAAFVESWATGSAESSQPI